MNNWLKISHWRHSGRLRAHEFTSYPPLFLMLFVVGFALTVCTVSAKTPYDGPESGYVGLSGTMPGPPPKVAATIKSPSGQQHFSTSPVTVSGTCPENTVVQIYKNEIFGGSATCGNDGTYSLKVDLIYGQNTLVARDFNALNEAGPDSNSVIVFNDEAPAQSAALAPLDLGGAQLLLNSDAVYRGVFPNQSFSIPVDILGGSAPYAVDIQWGDSSNKIVPRNDNQTFNVQHTYSKPGNYQISMQGTDGQGRVAFLAVAAIVNGQPLVSASTGSGGSSGSSASKLTVLWPLWASSVAMVVTFWLGERREKKVLAHRGFNFQTHI
ncbi:MAG TPA: hypothetical protein VFT49_02895 [Candidatus Saccharimonadales bacterium]|nr:hypothetical protein [Candidatus Saccharimonadales bacterium]